MYPYIVHAERKTCRQSEATAEAGGASERRPRVVPHTCTTARISHTLIHRLTTSLILNRRVVCVRHAHPPFGCIVRLWKTVKFLLYMWFLDKTRHLGLSFDSY